MGLLDGKVAVITGAGGGLGRAHALAMAREGAKVVVNDLGGSRDGVGNSDSMASQVVEEIRSLGGEAVANFDSVADAAGAEKVVRTAIENFGRIDILVNNAGILRDKTLLKMDDEQWKLVMAVHLDGTFYCGRAAARFMAENKIPGRIINTTSYSGLKGNYGQGNYGAAKAGIGALTKIWALELAKYGITVNAIAPMAKTRMTEDIDAVPEDIKPEQISPMFVYLASELSKDVNGRIFGVHGRHIFEYKTEITDGVKRESDWSPSEIAEQLPAISAAAAPNTDASDQGLNGRIKRAFNLMPVAFTPEKAGGWNAVIQFLIEGADSYTLTIQDKKCSVQPGVHGTPTCKVTVHADTMAGMIEGKISGQQAFMAGKIKASSLGDMMKFGKVFDFKRAREAAAQNATAAAPQAAAPTGSDQGLGGRIKRAFDLMPVAFTPEKAGGWNAVIQFLIDGADSYTLTVQDKKCSVQQGVHGKPTCKVTVHADTMAGMIEGKISGQQAFMAGKIKASGLGDMMKFGKVFDFKRARAAAAQEAGSNTSAAAPAATELNLEAVFQRLPEVFLPEQVSSWNGKVVLDIAGTDGWTVSIENRKCSVEKGKAAGAVGVLTSSVSNFAKILTDKLDLNAASTQGLLKASNPMALIKFNRAFDWKNPKLTQASAGSEAQASSSGGINPNIVGRRYRAPAIFVNPERIEEFAAATDDSSSREFAPPVFPVTLVSDVFRQMLGDDIGVDLSRMVHGEQSIQYFHPLRPWDLISPRGVITKIENKGSGQVLHFDQLLYREGELVTRISTSLFIRGEKRAEAKGESKKESKGESRSQPAQIENPTFTHTVKVSEDHPRRYAAASGDNNPIHLDPQVAQAAGFPSVILHGLCTMAFTGQAIVEKALGGDIRRLGELSVRFSKPVFPGDTLTIAGVQEEGGIRFTVTNQNGVAVITNGVARARSGASIGVTSLRREQPSGDAEPAYSVS